jgi:hypothetical protein
MNKLALDTDKTLSLISLGDLQNDGVTATCAKIHRNINIGKTASEYKADTQVSHFGEQKSPHLIQLVLVQLSVGSGKEQ